MRFVDCPGCGGMRVDYELYVTSDGYRCEDCVAEKRRLDDMAPETPVVDIRAFQEAKLQEALAENETLRARAEAAGFVHPEDGSEDRYRDRVAVGRISPAAHRFWWLVHNAVAHPLIAVAPRRPFFRFHDWTSRKLHGR